jgi:hypothetical protein
MCEAASLDASIEPTTSRDREARAQSLGEVSRKRVLGMGGKDMTTTVDEPKCFYCGGQLRLDPMTGYEKVEVECRDCKQTTRVEPIVQFEISPIKPPRKLEPKRDVCACGGYHEPEQGFNIRMVFSHDPDDPGAGSGGHIIQVCKKCGCMWFDHEALHRVGKKR